MSASHPSSAMILAAGLGKRMRPVTDTLPKPLVTVGGKALLDHGLERIEALGIRTIVVNVHYLADQIEAHLSGHPHIVLSDERGLLLETGGGVKRALPKLGKNPFFVLNSDTLWIEELSHLARMRDCWKADEMDALLLLAPLALSVGYDGAGDFSMDGAGRLTRRRKGETTPFVYAGAAILKPDLFENTPDGPFSLNLIFDRARERMGLRGLTLEGQWLHVGTPESILAAEARLRDHASGSFEMQLSEPSF